MDRPYVWKGGPDRRDKRCAPGEDRTHGLQIMRLTRCLLRYRGADVPFAESGHGLCAKRPPAPADKSRRPQNQNGAVGKGKTISCH